MFFFWNDILLFPISPHRPTDKSLRRRRRRIKIRWHAFHGYNQKMARPENIRSQLIWYSPYSWITSNQADKKKSGDLALMKTCATGLGAVLCPQCVLDDVSKKKKTYDCLFAGSSRCCWWITRNASEEWTPFVTSVNAVRDFGRRRSIHNVSRRDRFKWSALETCWPSTFRIARTVF